jgi:hypothetical protein
MGSNADVAQLVEHQLPKLRVAGSNPVVRSLPIEIGPAPPAIMISIGSAFDQRVHEPTPAEPASAATG